MPLYLYEEFLSIIPQPNMNGGPITDSVTASDSELEKTQTFAVEILFPSIK